MTQFVLCGHGSYGSSILESMEMLLPEIDGVHVIDFKKEMDSSDLTELIKTILSENDRSQILFICDIVGGAPFKLSAIESIGKENVGIIAGLNLASILEIYFMRDIPIQKLVETATQTAKQSIEFIVY